jgi:hypothetical protein
MQMLIEMVIILVIFHVKKFSFHISAQFSYLSIFYFFLIMDGSPNFIETIMLFCNSFL